MSFTSIARFRTGRLARSLFRRPAGRDYPAEHERLVTRDELLRYGFGAQLA